MGKENIVEWILAEAHVARFDNPLAAEWDTPKELKGYAGQLDALAMTHKGLTLIDFKFSSRISIEYFIQAALDARAFEPYDIDIRERAIIRFPKEEFQKVWDNKRFVYTLEPDELEVAWGNASQIEWDFEVGLHQREVLRWYNANKK